MYVKFDETTYCKVYIMGYFVLTNSHGEIRLPAEVYYALKKDGSITENCV